MPNPNPNNTKLEQERSDSATAALKGQTEDNHTENTEAAADRIADNLKNAKEEKQLALLTLLINKLLIKNNAISKQI